MNHPEHQPREIGENEKEKPVLTERQIQVLELVATGARDKKIANELGISPSTVKNAFSQKRSYRPGFYSGIFERLGVNNRIAAVIKAAKLEIIDLDKIVEPLTARDLEILRLLAKGKNIAQIAEDLHLKKQTIKNHLSSRKETCGYSGIYEKLGVPSSSAAAVTKAIQLGRLNLNEI